MCAGRILRKTGLTTSRSGELTLSDAEGTLKRRSVERQQDPLSSSLRQSSPANVPTPNTDGTMTLTGPILTVNSVSNPAAARRTDRSPAPYIRSRRQMTPTTSGHRQTYSTSSERRYSFDDESQQFDWSATLNLLSRLDDGQSTTRQRPEPVDAHISVRPEAVEPTIVATQVERCGEWEATLPSYARPRSDSAGRDDWQSRTLSGHRDYSSDSEDASDWLERQRRRLHQRKSTSPLTPTTSKVKARIFVPPARNELERRLIDELKASQERLNYDKSSYGGFPNGLYSSCTLPSLSRGQSLTNNSYDRAFSGDTGIGGRYSTLPGKGRVSGAGGVQRAVSELDFTVDTTRRGTSPYNDAAFDRHRSLTSLRNSDNITEQRIVKTTVSQMTGALLGRSHKSDATTITARTSLYFVLFICMCLCVFLYNPFFI